MEEDYVMIPGSGTKMIIRDVKKEIETAFLDYSMSVIVARALPDVRDGLKPVHRRILYTMHERGNDPSHPYRKSADTVGAVLGSYHPHGDASVYDAMVRLAQDFSLRYPLVDGQGNFGSVDGDPPAAYRYTEARMSRMAVEMLTDIEKDTIDWDPNFDETKKEPSVLPCRFPNLLVNGSQGIAVGMATNIPPHNLSEVIDGCIAYIDDPDIDLPGLMEHIKGPDFPTAGIIMGARGIRQAYETGRGKIYLRARAEIVESKGDRYKIVVTELPYQVNKRQLIKTIADQVKDKRIDGISDLLSDTFSQTTGTGGSGGLVNDFVTQHPSQFTGGGTGGTTIWSTIETLCNNVVVPIGGFILTVILLNELIQMVLRGNNFKDFDDSIFIKWIIKALCGVILVANTYYIASALFSFGTTVCSNGLATLFGTGDYLSSTLSINPSALSGLSLGELMTVWFISLIVHLGVLILIVAIVITLASRIIEVFMYLSIAPIPMATMMDSGEWASIGKNWIKQLLALSFQGFFIVVALGIFKTLFSNAIVALNASTDGVILQMGLLLGYTAALIFTILRTGAISKSVFNAH